MPSASTPLLTAEIGIQSPSIANRGNSSTAIAAAGRIANDQLLGLRLMVPTYGGTNGYSVEVLWRRMFPGASNTKFFFEGTVGEHQVKSERSGLIQSMTSIGVGVGLAYSISNSARVGALAGADFVDTPLEYSGPTRISGAFGEIAPKLGVQLGMNL